jgi:hypothetical protein
MQFRKHRKTKKDDGRKTASSILIGVLIFSYLMSNHVISTMAQNISGKEVLIVSTNSNNVVEHAIDAIGGMKSIQSIRTEFISADGQRYEPGQKFTSEEYPKYDSSYHYNATHDLISNSLHMNWQREVVYPYPQNLKYTVVIVNNTGFINGKDGLFSPPKAPMQSSHVNAILKEQLITSPHLLLRSAVEHPESVVIQPDEQFEGRLHHIISWESCTTS